jgi:hypothetical protein
MGADEGRQTRRARKRIKEEKENVPLCRERERGRGRQRVTNETGRPTAAKKMIAVGNIHKEREREREENYGTGRKDQKGTILQKAKNDSCGIRTHALSDQRLKLAP